MDLRALAVLCLIPLSAAASDPVVPLTVCEVLANLPAHEGKDVAVLGRYSFRRDGRWIGEQACEAATTAPPLLWLTEDAVEGPKPPGNFEFDVAVLNKKFATLTKKTTLG